MKWQPIETAPKDGTIIFVARNMGDTWGWVMGTAYFETISQNVYGWISKGVSEPPGNLGLARPSHWMPLPEPPNEQDN